MTKDEFIEQAKKFEYTESDIKGLLKLYQKMRQHGTIRDYGEIPLMPQLVPGYGPEHDTN